MINIGNVWGICRRELAAFFNSPIAYIVLGVFLLAAGWLFFFFSGLFIEGRASLRPFFAVAPVLVMFLAPAVTMRLVAEERKSGTLESLMSLPVRDWEILLGKFVAAVLMVSIGFAFTFAYPLTLSLLTEAGTALDKGPIIGGYVGLVLMSSAFLAAGIWASTVSKNQIIGFMLGLAVCFALWVVDKSSIIHPSIGAVLSYLGVSSHFESVARGVIDTRDLLYYLTVVVLFLSLAAGALRGVRQGVAKAMNPVEALVVGSLVLLNILNLGVFARIDLTSDGAYTLSEATEETLGKLEAPVKITAYFTDDLPPPFSENARYTKDLLEEYRAASGGQLSFEILDPQRRETDEDKEIKKEVKRDIFGRAVREKTSVETDLEGLGIQPVEVRVFEQDQAQTKRAYMGIAVRYGEEKEAIPVVQDIATLEYDLTSIIRRLVREKLPVIAVVQGHDEPSLSEGGLEKLSSLLKANYELKPMNIGAGPIGDDIDAVLVVGPKKAFGEEELRALDDWIMKGKAAAFFLDRFSVDYTMFAPTPTEQNLDGLVSAYGIELGSQLVGDVECASLNVQERRGIMLLQMPVKYPFIPMPKSLEGNSAMVKGIGDIPLPFVSPLYPKPELAGVEVAALAKSSSKSWLEDPTGEVLNPKRDWGTADIGFTGPYTLIATARGTLPSAFDAAKKSAAEARVIVVGSSGLLNDQVMGPQNAALVLNMIDWLSLDAKLLAMRTRGFADAPLQKELSDGARNGAKVGNTIGVPVLLALFGVARWRLRESRRKKLAVVP